MSRWINLTKGISIILVVMLHTTLGIEKELGEGGFLLAVVAWAKPFRIPDFFLICGYLAAGIGTLNWRRFLDRKVLRYVYFYVLWLVIVLAIKAFSDGPASGPDLAKSIAVGLIEPFSTLWFIYILPFFMLAARFCRGWLAVVMTVGAVLLHVWAAAYPAGGSYALDTQATPFMAINSFALFFIFFLIGYLCHERIDALLDFVRRRPLFAASLIALWAGAHSYALHLGLPGIPGLSLMFGLLGGLALMAVARLAEHLPGLGWLAYCGQHSLAIYLAFVVPMAASREFLLRTGFVTQPDLVTILVLFLAVGGPLLLERAVRDRAPRFLFARPRWATLS